MCTRRNFYGTSTWRKLRAAHLALEPLCRACKAMGRLTPARHVDHIRAISDGGNPFPDHDGLQSLCTACHSAKTARGAEAGAARSNKPRKGCDANGNPLDPEHPWKKSLRAGGIEARVGLKTQLVSSNTKGRSDG